MDITELVKVRKPTNDEQRCGKIATSDYMISGVTIHSSVLKTLGWIDKVYRRKEAIVKRGNKNEIKKAKRFLSSFNTKCTPYSQFELLKDAKEHSSFVECVQSKSYTSWVDVKMDIPNFIIMKNFKSPSNFIKAFEKANRFIELFDEDGVLEGMSEYKFEKNKTIKSLIPLFNEHFDKIETNHITKHSQTVIWEEAYKFQMSLEEKLGKNFTPKDYAKTLSEWILDKIKKEWDINLLKYKGSWSDLCDYLYSPKMIKRIREKLGVKVRSRHLNGTRKGVESNDKKQFAKIIERKKSFLGNDFNLSREQRALKKSEKDFNIAKTELEEAKYILKHALSIGDPSAKQLKKEVESLRQKYNYAHKKFKMLMKDFSKKKDAYDIIKEYEQKQNLIDEMMKECRSGEEISAFELEENLEAIRKQKAEEQIPYYTWRFVCDKIDNKTAKAIETALEEGLNKEGGINGERGYINVTSFPMNRSYEFFVDYPKNSNLFRAFSAKGLKLSKILIEGVANHIHKQFVNCQGETFINSPMEKTLNGDMLEWVEI